MRAIPKIKHKYNKNRLEEAKDFEVWGCNHCYKFKVKFRGQTLMTVHTQYIDGQLILGSTHN